MTEKRQHHISIRVKKDLYEQIVKAASREGRSLSNFVEALVQRVLIKKG